ncbi:DsbA family protein [Flavobacterium chungangense]|uniref:Protein-disulfide isomerase n=1 Tax=Flavobacterium chungangense TaxID=554283 RepID=A0A6V6YZ77_9FLAO|nr:DsbA family protein [Flavobacterium chungangense]CAD0004793.1 protein-disulfide isomerase [Flavobacterium chungangense]
MKLIYIMDPLCGWCYGNTTNIVKLYEKYKDNLDFTILPAGMWTGENARKQTTQIAAYIKKHDPQIQQITGTEFGNDYFKFIENQEIILDSEIPSRAIVTATKLWESKAVVFAAEVQKARYWYGKDLNADDTYLAVCDILNLNKTEFLKAFHSEVLKQETQNTFDKALHYARSYPTLLAQKDDKIFILEQGYAKFEAITKQIDALFF